MVHLPGVDRDVHESRPEDATAAADQDPRPAGLPSRSQPAAREGAPATVCVCQPSQRGRR
jgi:hypothetical protein